MRFGGALRILSGAVLAGAALTAVAAPVRGATAPKRAVVSLRGAGAWGAYEEMPQWKNDLFGAPAGVTLQFAPHGSLLARESVLNGDADFALSGVPFTKPELAQAGARTFIDAPIQVSSLAFIVDPPANGLTQLDQICDPSDPPPEFVDNPDGCLIRTPYKGPVRFPADNLAAVMFRYPFGGAPPLRSWSNPAVLGAWGFQACLTAPPGSGCGLTQLPSAGPGVVGRSDGDETSYYLQQYAKTASPKVWKLLQGFFAPVKAEPITERLPILSGNTRDGVDQQQLQLLQGGADPVTGSLDTATTTGAVGYLPASAMHALAQLHDAAGLSFVQVQNANGDWVAPTPRSIDAAVGAGTTTPLFALTHKVKDAYPLVWIEHLYAPAHGLPIAKIEALAAVIRYIATAGQDVAVTVGEGRLPNSLVTKSLRAADDLVRSNCVGGGRAVFTSSDPGPFVPALPALGQIGPMLHCGLASPTPTSTTTVPPTTVATTPTTFSNLGVPTSPFSTTPAPTRSTTPSTAGTTPTRVATSSTTTSSTVARIPAALSVSKLPLSGPSSSNGGDALATFLLGAGLFVVLRKPAGRLAKLVVP